MGTQLALAPPPFGGTPFGSASFEVLAGDELCFVMSSENADQPNAPIATITNFEGPACEFPARDIVAEARRGYNGLIMGCTGMGQMKGLAVGSVSTKIIGALSDIPICIVAGAPVERQCCPLLEILRWLGKQKNLTREGTGTLILADDVWDPS